uniref:Uncharacterized protein n=1 Tax=Anguilla anguilla TaxID=7936 RepID=A0A0E9R3W5_ANGAN
MSCQQMLSFIRSYLMGYIQW